MPYNPITPVECTPGTAGSYQDVDIDNFIADLGSDVKGVQLMIYNTGSSGYAVSVRKNGSTDDIYYSVRLSSRTGVSIGVDASKIFEAKIYNTNIKIFIVGYFTGNEFTFFDNGTNKSTASTGSWQDVNCSSEASGAIGLFFVLENTSTYSREFGLRMNGSTDSRINTVIGNNCMGAIIGCDGSQICEQYIGNTSVDLYLIGYVTANVTINTNASDRSMGSTGSYADLTALPSGAIAGIYEICASAQYSWDQRENGTSLVYYYDAYLHSWNVVKCDASRVVEGKIENVDVDFYEIGYFSSGSAPSNNIMAAVSHIKQQRGM